MRMLLVIGIAALASIGPVADAANPAGSAGGRLAGETQISFGCPGPVRVGAPGCNPWHLFAHARFSVAGRSTSGAPNPGTSRVVISDARGRFALRVPIGSYLVTPLPQAHTHGGIRLTVQVRTDQETAILVRFTGFPQME